MISRFILIVGVILNIILTLPYLKKPIRKQIDANNLGQQLLLMPRIYNYLGFLCLAVADIFAISFVSLGITDITTLVIIFITLILFGGLGLRSVNYYRNHYAFSNESFIEVSTGKGFVGVIYWKDLYHVTFNPYTGFLILQSGSGNKLKLHKHLQGFSMFVHYIEFKRRVQK